MAKLSRNFFFFGHRGESFSGEESGIAASDTICNPQAVGISVDANPYEPHILAGTMTHMIGHNIGMSHDDGSEYIKCDFFFF